MFWCYPLHLHSEDGKIRSQLWSYEYDCFIPYFTQNTQGRWCPYIPGGFNYSKGLAVHDRSSLVSYFPPSARRLLQYVYDRTFSASVRQNNQPDIILTPNPTSDWSHQSLNITHYIPLIPLPPLSSCQFGPDLPYMTPCAVLPMFMSIYILKP